MKGTVGVEECRMLLGDEANGMTDAEVVALRDELERTADVLYSQMITEGLDGLQAARWDTHLRLTGEGE